MLLCQPLGRDKFSFPVNHGNKMLKDYFDNTKVYETQSIQE